jgi:hypothetical protein
MCCNMRIGLMGSIPPAMPVLVMSGCLENFHSSTCDETIALTFILFEKFFRYRQKKKRKFADSLPVIGKAGVV